MSIIESIGVQGLQWVASEIVSRLISQGFSYVGMDVPKELTELETDILPKISLVMKAFPMGSTNNLPALKPWLQRLKDAYYEAEDLLDEAEYQRVAKLVKHQKRKLLVRISSHPVIKPLTKFCDKVSRKLPFQSSQKRKLLRGLTNFRDNIKKLVEDAQFFYGLLQNLAQNATMIAKAPIVLVTSSLPLNNVFGRDEDRNDLVKLLLEQPVGESSKQSYSVVAIVGRGGAGKTTLAQYVFNDERIIWHFDTRIWVCLKRKLDIIEHTKEMIQSATKKESPQHSSLDALQYDLSKILLGSKNILVVLDDVWFNKKELQREEEWERLMAPFTSIGKCKVLLTSRSKELPVALYTRHLIDLKDLKEHELISLFRHYSHLEEVGCSHLRHDLETISVEIVARLGRSTLATKTVAGRLGNQRDVNVWRRTLETADFKDERDALMWSFQQLEEPLQRCFLYFGMFPRGVRFRKTTLVTSWCALNLITSPDMRRSAEDIGEEYLDELVASFFLQSTYTETRSELGYTIHDSFHDLAQNISRDDCFLIEDDKVIENIPSTVRHMCIAVGNIKQHVPNICKLENLRSLSFLVPIEVDHSSTVLNEILGNLKKLRLLDINSLPHTTNLAEAIGTMKFLKLLNIRPHSPIKQVPETLSMLYNLRYLFIPEVRSLPRHMSNLINLHTIVCRDKYNQQVPSIPPIRDIGKMTSLQVLPEFHVKKERGYEIHQLGQLRQLRGHLKVSGLENVQHKDEAAQARLAEKMGLVNLELVWTFNLLELAISGYEIRDLDSQVIDVLQPPSNLKKLIISGYAGARYPAWFANTLVIQNLNSIKLALCSALELLPSNFHSWRNCYELELSGNLALRELPNLPEKLERLSIELCPSLVLLSEKDLHSNQQSVLLSELLVILISMIASCIDQHAYLDYYYNYLTNIHQGEWVSFKQISIIMKREHSEYMQVFGRSMEDNSNTLLFGMDQLKAWWHCHRERINFIYGSAIQENQIKSLSYLRYLNITSCSITDGALSDCMLGLISLEILILRGIMSLTTLPGEDILINLKCLRDLEINGCWLLQSLGALHTISSLERLMVVFCPCLDLEKENNIPYSGLPSSLQSLLIDIGSIPSGILNSALPCLSTIDFRNCRSAPSLSIGHLTSLRTLALYNCRDICFLEGLQLLCNLEKLCLIRVPKLELEKSVLESWPGCTEILRIGSMQLLKVFFSLDAFVAPRYFQLEHIEDEAVTFDSEFEFEGSTVQLHQKLEHVQFLFFYRCKTKSLPTSLGTVFSSLKWIRFLDCPELSSLPELPQSVTVIEIKGCPVLQERCRRHSGEDWPKISHIRWKYIE